MYIPSMSKALGSIPSMAKKKLLKKRKIRELGTDGSCLQFSYSGGRDQEDCDL
jgi:hypothetical protein